jgi:membrane associated rhomboid family serine protease
VYSTLTASFQRFERSVPNDLTERLHFDPNHPTLTSMLTAAFTHGDWWHLTSNLIFFFAFAASVETIVGYFYFFGFVVLSAVGTHLAYSYSVSGLKSAVPTVGLSGVVMAMMAFLATVMPTLRIRWFEC